MEVQLLCFIWFWSVGVSRGASRGETTRGDGHMGKIQYELEIRHFTFMQRDKIKIPEFLSSQGTRLE
jgi:hypothetical protein